MEAGIPANHRERPRVPPSVAVRRITEASCTRNIKTAVAIYVSGSCCTKGTTSLMALPAVGRAFRILRRDANLRLAAQPGVGHIRLDGAVAEWLKAAV